ncbi:MAG: ribosome biogenesis GTPase YlqF [Alicyclobacillaceae bacterium]|nr:ribosome biogenesis GTPase YlqF [Alicyclobacillaceae bacterium]
MATIQWYPGHMAKARREVGERIRQVDVVMELVDARIPSASRNPVLHELIGDRPRLVVLTREDMADPQMTNLWIRFFEDRGWQAVAVDAQRGRGLGRIAPAVRKLAAPAVERWRRRGVRNRPVRAMILGIPNVGKSSLINRLAGRTAAKTGDLPGVTRSQQWIRVGGDFELLDTPGILWPKFEDPETGLLLAATGAIKEEILPVEEVALFILERLRADYPLPLEERYGPLPGAREEWLAAVGRRRGLLLPGGEVHIRGAAELICREFRSGRLGRVTLERPPASNGGEKNRPPNFDPGGGA